MDLGTHQLLSQATETFRYDRQGWQDFTADLWVIGLEASGPYSALLEDHLLGLERTDVRLYRFSLAQVRDFAKSRSRCRTKTDTLDAQILAFFLLHYWTTHHLSIPLRPGTLTSLATLARLYDRLTRERTRIQNQVRQLLYYLLPALERRYRRFPKALRTLLQAFPSAPAMAQASLEDRQNALSPAQTRLLSLSDLHRLMQSSFGLHAPPGPGFALPAPFVGPPGAGTPPPAGNPHPGPAGPLPAGLEVADRHPRHGPTLAALFLALVGDIRRFSSPKA